MKKVVVAGGGAAGFFAALTCAASPPDASVTVLEKSQKLLAKVSISGGGRCNVTHACFDTRTLVGFYPRGEKQLLGPFNRFGPAQTIQWFAERGVKLKTEGDGRMFPVTDTSQTIIDCFLREARERKIAIHRGCGIAKLVREKEEWIVYTSKGDALVADAVIIATGASPSVWNLLQQLGHRIVSPVPSLFTFTIRDSRLQYLPGVSVEQVCLSVPGYKNLETDGPLLITHWGLSGPAVLKLSAWGARELATKNYRFELAVNWTGRQNKQQVIGAIEQCRQTHARKRVSNFPLFHLPLRLWQSLVTTEQLNFADLSRHHIEQLAETLTRTIFRVEGKANFKEEFVTAGGVDLKEIDFKTMESKLFKGLYFAGEVLDIDAVTGGFNFQAAWTTAYVAGSSV